MLVEPRFLKQVVKIPQHIPGTFLSSYWASELDP